MTDVRTDASTRVPGPLHPLLRGEREYPFITLARRRAELMPPGVEPIDFSMGDPRDRTPGFIRETLAQSVPEVSSYPAVAGQPALRQAYAGWARRRFGVTLDPERHVLPANGTKEAVFLLAQVVTDVAGGRDTVVIPTPAYPVYEPGARFAGATPHFVPLSAGDGFRFDPARVADAVWARTALLWINSPHNPTGAVLDRARLDAIGSLARRHGFWVAADEAYGDLWFDVPVHSMLETGLDNVLALHTLSKRSAMTGFRSGMMSGDPRLIEALRRFRPNVGVATPDFVQAAAIAAWSDDAHTEALRQLYAAKRVLFLADFARRGWKVEASEATFYLWFRVPGGDDVAFVEKLLGLGIVALPGRWLGAGGEGFVRWALVPTLEKCREAIARLDAAGDSLR